MDGDTEVFRLDSLRWKAAATLLLLVGVLAAFGLAAGILQIDGAATADQFTPSQDAVGLTAFVVGVGGAVAAAVVAVRWWRRPALQATLEAVTVYNRRPVAVPWPMISMVSHDHDAPGLILVNGAFLRARCIRRLTRPLVRSAASGTPAPATDGPNTTDRIPAPRLSTSLHRAPIYMGDGGRPDRRVEKLPGRILAQVRTEPPWAIFRWIMIAPLCAGLLVLLPDGDGGAQSGVDVGGAAVVVLVFGVLVATVLLGFWMTLSRTVAVGEGWVAWRPRLARQWRILRLADLVSTIDLRWTARTGVRMSRVDGTGMHLRAPELTQGLGSVLSAELLGHPAARAELDAVLSASPVAATPMGGMGFNPPGSVLVGRNNSFVVNSWRYPRSTKQLLRAEALETWKAFEDQPGVFLKWRQLDRKRSELVRENGTVMAQVRDGRVRTVTMGDRTYVGQPTAFGNLLPRRSRNRGRLGILSDAATDEQVLSVTGYHFNYKATSVVHLSDGPTFHFPVSRLRDAEGWCDVGC